MKAIYLRTALLIGFIASLMACGSGGNSKGNTEKKEVETYKSTKYAGFTSSHVIAMQDSLLFLYNVEEDTTLPFHMREKDEIFNFKFDPDGRTMYYTVVREGTLWLRKATFSDEGGTLEDLVNLNIPKEKCVSYLLDDRSPLEYKDGKLLLSSDFSWDTYDFSTYTIYNIADNSLMTTRDRSKMEELFEVSYEPLGASFEVEEEQLIYKKNNQRYSLTDKLDLRLNNKYSSDENIEYFEATFSPDGSKIAFVAIAEWGDLGVGPLCIADADGKNQRILSEDATPYLIKLQWIGNSLFFIDADEDPESESGTALYSTDPDNGNARRRHFSDTKRFDIKQPAK
ncbi:PD40 domain-containing protein [Porphyromonas circumdentaria]|uniref:WD40-like Beta Propeller Repeat n=1 Tax=Porphyromonas circumdentaria TaxID=29524 RepID=A0A1T4NZX7_9PORP|nr:PD40 domain-containing protein [Porphyromonas circumdentaria]MBB6276248.1 Tol biopolymer transport system component [Porphyromonas circumdentaria]MDO4722280.1 PD40 domain-containing protein [Porphyromonas circumdentaria]SJZ84672.1 WD40-like Beta Propeller Repeat [Porphyromonas circumdentaria]